VTCERNSIILGDCIEVMRGLPADSIDAIVTDPPYGIEFMGKEWDGFGTPLGFQTWSEQWAREALRVLKPGGHLLAFGGTRMYHRLAAGIEDAGFEIRDTLMWLYGSGFPKSLDVSKAIDKAAGAEREVVGRNPNSREGATIANSLYEPGTVGKTANITAPSTEAAKKWQGWGTALKPAVEPIVLARKPLIGTVAENVLAHGTGALNIDASRIGSEERTYALTMTSGNFETTGGNKNEKSGSATVTGRWPANTLWDEEAAAVLDASTPAQPSRFFYVAKSGKHERNAGGVTNIHPTVKPIALMRYLIKLVTPPGGVVLDPFLGSGTTACAAVLDGFDYIGIEQGAEYVDIARARIQHWAKQSEDQK
jgi:site-specific DNA-methyltransferase (adenine-specific)